METEPSTSKSSGLKSAAAVTGNGELACIVIGLVW